MTGKRPRNGCNLPHANDPCKSGWHPGGSLRYCARARRESPAAVEKPERISDRHLHSWSVWYLQAAVDKSVGELVFRVLGRTQEIVCTEVTLGRKKQSRLKSSQVMCRPRAASCSGERASAVTIGYQLPGTIARSGGDKNEGNQY